MMRMKFIYLCLLLTCGSCNEKIFTADVDCDHCYTDRPESGDISVSITINYKYPRVPVTIYSGDIEDKNIVATDTVSSSPVYFYVPVNHKYSVKAEYINSNEGTTTFVVDGTNFKILSVSDACEEQCYVYANDKMDARISKAFQ